MRTCPLCHYVRTPCDPLPDWQCPECGAPYAEGLRRVQSGLAHPPTVSRQSTGTKVLLITLVLIALLFVGGWYAVRDFAEPTSRALPAAAMKGHIPAARQSQPRVLMYATSWCPYCAAARAFFQQHGVKYTEYDVERDMAARARFERFGGGVPIIMVGETVVRGFDQRQLSTLLRPWMEQRSGQIRDG
jgi:glutaredoxin